MACYVSNECKKYIPSPLENIQWLVDHAGQEIEIIGDDGDIGAFKRYKGQAADGTIGWLWKREIDERD